MKLCSLQVQFFFEFLVSVSFPPPPAMPCHASLMAGWGGEGLGRTYTGYCFFEATALSHLC